MTAPDNIPLNLLAAPVVTPQVQLPPSVSDKDAQMLAAAIGSFAQPLADAQKTAAVEATKQAQIIADVTRSVYRGFFYIAVMIIALAGIAMLTGKDQTAEKLIFGLLGFLGGVGFSKWVKK